MQTEITNKEEDHLIEDLRKQPTLSKFKSNLL